MSEDQPQRPSGSEANSLRLTPRERAVLLRACQRYRSTIPTYLHTNREELVLLDELLKKLAPSEE